MSTTKIIGVTSAFIFSAVLLVSAYNSRQSFDKANPELTTTDTLSGTKLESKFYKNKTSIKKQTLSRHEVKQRLEQKLPGMLISEIEESPVAGFYQAFFDSELIYVSQDAQYIFTGNMLELGEGQPINHSQLAIVERDARQAPLRAQTIAQINEQDMVIFRAGNEKHVITVFTDVDCAYCRKLHKEIPELNNNGVTIRYLAYPRAGIGSDAYKKLVSVWCAEDKLAAMDDAKLRRKFGQNICENPIANQYNLTRKFNLSGTPSLILSDGELIAGYLPAEKILAHLNQKKATLISEK